MSADHTHRVHDADTQHQHWKPPVSEDYPDFREYSELHVPRRRRIPIIPDLRLEQGFSKMMQPYIHVLRDPVNDKGKEIASGGLGGAVSNEIIEIQWGRVAWITARESIISPLIQGAIRIQSPVSNSTTPTVTAVVVRMVSGAAR
ncbi:hypothetical protein IEO21_05289 [Rhodonia placenta]|uniref:Uncharacterized protein n=1 Tax=Rhodonia placenta TaxID=104341 RepID=A0A8H7P2I0_9APHY|nr:hypothetical protein IEO21_05289 [Postia placenta]